jgi:uncharacterized protein YlxW (UPF0749 family)
MLLCWLRKGLSRCQVVQLHRLHGLQVLQYRVPESGLAQPQSTIYIVRYDSDFVTIIIVLLPSVFRFIRSVLVLLQAACKLMQEMKKAQRRVYAATRRPYYERRVKDNNKNQNEKRQEIQKTKNISAHEKRRHMVGILRSERTR